MLGAKSKISLLPHHRHHHPKLNVRPACNNILEAIGNTPLVRLNSITSHLQNVEIYVKCEYLNPGGSIKDRVALAMIENKKKLIEQFLSKDENHRILEPTSGNTGVGMGLVCAVHGFKCQFLIHHKCSDEKVKTMRLLGAELKCLDDDVNGMEAALKLVNTGKYLMLDQFSNTLNPVAHYEHTAVEIIEALAQSADGPKTVDYLVCSAGSGGTMTGITTMLKEVIPPLKLIAADIEGSQNFHNGKKHPFEVEGILGKSDPPLNECKDQVDYVEVVSDQDAFIMARRMASEEGILCGGSSGMAVKAAVSFAEKNIRPNKKAVMVVILPDGIRNGMTKFVADQWMEAKLYKPPPIRRDAGWYNVPIEKFIKYLPENHKEPKILKVLDTDGCKGVLETMINAKQDVALVMHGDMPNSDLVGLVSLNSIRHNLTDPVELYLNEFSASIDEPIVKFMEKDLNLLALNSDCEYSTAGLVSRVLDIGRYVVIGMAKYYEPEDKEKVIKQLCSPLNVVSAEDMAAFIQEYSARPPSSWMQFRRRPTELPCEACDACKE